MPRLPSLRPAPAILAACLAACAAAPPPPPATGAPRAPASEPPTQQGTFSLLDPGTDLSALHLGAAVPASSLPAFTGRVEPLPLPAGTGGIIGIAARDAKDVWMMARGGALLHWNGARVVARGGPTCFTDSCCGTLIDCAKQPAQCTKQAFEACRAVSQNCAMPVDFEGIRVTADEVIAEALVQTGGLRGSLVEAHLGKGGRWSCHQGKGALLHWNGARVVARGGPTCFTDSCCGTLIDCAKQPAQCTKQAFEACRAVSQNCAMPVDFEGIRVTADEVIAEALVQTGGLRGSLVEAHLGKGGRWSCHQGKGDLIHPGSRGRGDGPHAEELTAGGSTFRFEGPARLVNPLGGYSLVVDGRRVPLPADVGFTNLGFAARGPGELWLWSSGGGQLWRGNGLGWSAVPTEIGSIEELWTEGQAIVWIRGDEELLRWDTETGARQLFALPTATGRIPAGKGFWILGKEAFYLWDGRALSRLAAPLEPMASARSPGGEIWVAGSVPGSIRPESEDKGVGVVVRLPAIEGSTP